MSGWVRRWQHRIQAAEDLREAEAAEAERLLGGFPESVRSASGELVRFELRWSGEAKFEGLSNIFLLLGLLVKAIWSTGAWIVFRDGWTIWVSAKGYQRSKFRYPSYVLALRDGARLATMAEVHGPGALGLRPVALAVRRARLRVQLPQDSTAGLKPGSKGHAVWRHPRREHSGGSS